MKQRALLLANLYLYIYLVYIYSISFPFFLIYQITKI